MMWLVGSKLMCINARKTRPKTLQMKVARSLLFISKAQTHHTTAGASKQRLMMDSLIDSNNKEQLVSLRKIIIRSLFPSNDDKAACWILIFPKHSMACDACDARPIHEHDS
jgi:hypothetical protein